MRILGAVSYTDRAQSSVCSLSRTRREVFPMCCWHFSGYSVLSFMQCEFSTQSVRCHVIAVKFSNCAAGAFQDSQYRYFAVRAQSVCCCMPTAKLSTALSWRFPGYLMLILGAVNYTARAQSSVCFAVAYSPRSFPTAPMALSRILGAVSYTARAQSSVRFTVAYSPRKLSNRADGAFPDPRRTVSYAARGSVLSPFCCRVLTVKLSDCVDRGRFPGYSALSVIQPELSPQSVLLSRTHREAFRLRR